jgi:hypothetical protein
MSTTKSEGDRPIVFAAIRFRGDWLEPRRVTEILHTQPTLAYRKGEVYKRDSRGHAAHGRTGLWLLSTEKRVPSTEVIDHLRYLIGVLFPDGADDRINPLRHLLRDRHIEADVLVFWHGEPGQPQPTIPDSIRTTFRRVPAQIEQDFEVAV